ncbi:4Fe-4S dicluster domain-containing protein [Actinomadura logoneensis]|uniref:ferredoxin--NADP(+) reductase n=1 Tax=Actinomadura logoneensis TaxID=2293572 RepID=A0A372JDL8_9ACTN|nr:FAD-dependent oxidoreductase [Actinomadura logoneensis]RFU38060.1 4Fe-4S dicluster domain-containing protein [Actinomadura logoneensis]
MPHVVTQSCCNDASCVHACPVNCIHPTPDEPDFGTAEMLYIDPAACVDCGACVTACPVGAIRPHGGLDEAQRPFLEINADFYKDGRTRRGILAPHEPPLHVTTREPLRVAIVGSGPSAMYAADEILTIPGARVDVYERLATPYGLVRTGVAPDHVDTRRVIEVFDRISRQDGFHLHLGVEVGGRVGHADLLRDHHAVLYATGASSDRRLDVPGADGVTTATEFVAWYNGHPDHADHRFDLSHRRAVVIGNGNVALDVARVLTTPPDALARTPVSRAALEALRVGAVEEVVVVGRRGPADSAFTLPELVGLRSAVEVVVPPADLVGLDDASLKHRAIRDLGREPSGGRRVTLRYLLAPAEITDTGVTFTRNAPHTEDGRTTYVPTGETVHLEAGLVLTSIGYRARPLPGLPFDERRAVVPNDRGRVVDPATGAPVPGTYVTGWIKRGPTGFIGTNKTCARETVRQLVADHNAGRLPRPAAVPSPA